MWNLEYTIPTFLILLILLVYYAYRPKLRTRLNTAFTWLLVVDVFTMLFDYVSTSMDIHHDLYSIPSLYLVNALYFVCFIGRSYLFYRLTVYILESHLKNMKWVSMCSLAVLTISELAPILSPWKHFMFSIDQDGYHSGPFYNILYVQALYYVILSLILLLLCRKALSQFDFVTVLMFNFLLLCGVVIRYLLPKVVIMNMFCLLAIFALFLNYQNPEHFIDKKTGLFSRVALETTMSELIFSSRPRQLIAFVIKSYVENRELYGSRQMDAGIVSIANYLKETFPKFTLYYLRNGQFVLGTRDNVNTNQIYKTIKARFEMPWKAKNADLYLQVGFVTERGHSEFQTVEQFMDCLQDSFRKVDHLGDHDHLHLDESRRQEWLHQLAVKRAVDNAISENLVEVYLQPIVDAKTEEVVGAEALARIIDPEVGMIMPGDFISIAEKNGSIVLLGEQIFRKTCSFLASYGEFLNIRWINVNLSPIQCMDINLPKDFLAIIKEYGISSDKIHLEITEQQNIDLELMSERIEEMRKRGFAFVLDDYGTGYSNMERIRKLPLVNVKMDMNMVWDYFKKPDQLLPLSIELAKNMDASVTAEGVETGYMAETLTKLGCEYLQGFYYSKPVTMTEFIEKYRKRS